MFDCTFLATVPGYMADGRHTGRVPALLHMDTLAGANFLPTLYVDISDAIGTKIEMMAKHQSQITWLKEHDGVDILADIDTLARVRDMQAGCRADTERMLSDTTASDPHLVSQEGYGA